MRTFLPEPLERVDDVPSKIGSTVSFRSACLTSCGAAKNFRWPLRSAVGPLSSPRRSVREPIEFRHIILWPLQTRKNPPYSARKTLPYYFSIQICEHGGFPDMPVGYMRVSRDHDRQTTARQRDALLDAGVAPRHLFEDQTSGVRDDRHGLAQALADVQPGDCLVVWKLDRLGRSLPHLLQIVTTLQAQGVAFRSLTEQMDTTTPQGTFLFSVFGALAQYERAVAQERIRAGLEAARRRGKRGGRPRALSPEQVDAICAALQAGTSQAAICRTFGVKRSTPYDAMARVEGPPAASDEGSEELS